MRARLLYIITQTELGGAQRYVLDLAQAAQQHFEVAVATGADGDGSFDRELSRHGVSHFKLHQLRRDINALQDFRALLEIKSLLRKLQPDLVHLNSTKAGVLGSLACGPKVRSVYTAHGWVFNEDLSRLKKQLYINSERFSARLLDRIIVLSHFDWERGAAVGIPREKMLVIQNGIQAQDYVPRETARHELALWCRGLLESDPLILTIANFYPTKGLRYLVEAMQYVRPDAARAVVIGDGEQRELLEKLIHEYHQEGRVLLPGRMNDAARFMQAADVFVLPSVKEGLPYVILEALEAEVPIVATAVGALPEILDTGLVPAGHARALAQAISAQLSSPQRGSRPAPSFEQMRDQTFGLYEQVLGRQGG